MVKLRGQAEVVVMFEIMSKPIQVCKEIWVINDDLNRAVDYIDPDEFMEALSLLSLEG